jgi:diguanylate cyclase (GGDEF)-like protein
LPVVGCHGRRHLFSEFQRAALCRRDDPDQLGSSVPGALLSGQSLLYVVLLQAPLYFTAMTSAAFTLNRMLVATMRAERENNRRAKHDALTGLLNREGLIEAIEAGLIAAAAYGKPRALLFLDLDNFKTVNDTFGHAVGDRLLKAVADRLKAELAAGDVAARIGGDEFVVLAVAANNERAIERGERLISAIASTYPLGEGISAAVGASIGVAVTPEHGSHAEGLLAAADAALYEAKSGGRSRCCLASAAFSLAALHRLQVGIGACRGQRCGVSRYIVRPSGAGEEAVASMVERRLHLSSLKRG